MFHESKGLCRGLKSLVFRFIGGVLGVIHRVDPLGSGGRPVGRERREWAMFALRPLGAPRDDDRVGDGPQASVLVG